MTAASCSFLLSYQGLPGDFAPRSFLVASPATPSATLLPKATSSYPGSPQVLAAGLQERAIYDLREIEEQKFIVEPFAWLLAIRD